MTTLGEFLRNHRAEREFEAAPYYDPVLDCVIFYARRARSYAKRVNSLLTLYLDERDDSLVGCKVKCVRLLAERFGQVGVMVEDRRANLSMLVAFAYAQVVESELAGGSPARDEDNDHLKQLTLWTEGQTVDLEEEEPCGA